MRGTIVRCVLRIIEHVRNLNGKLSVSDKHPSNITDSIVKTSKSRFKFEGLRIRIKTILGSLAALWDFHKALIVAVRNL